MLQHNRFNIVRWLVLSTTTLSCIYAIIRYFSIPGIPIVVINCAVPPFLFFFFRKNTINRIGVFLLVCPIIFVLETLYIVLRGLPMPSQLSINQLATIFTLCLFLFALFGEHLSGRLRKHIDLYLYPLLALTILEYVIIYLKTPFNLPPYIFLLVAISGFYLIMVRQLRLNERLIAEQHQTIINARIMFRSVIHDLANIIAAAGGWSNLAFKVRDEIRRKENQEKATGSFRHATDHIKTVTAILNDSRTIVSLSQMTPINFCESIIYFLKNNHVGEMAVVTDEEPEFRENTLLFAHPVKFTGKHIYADTHAFGNALLNLVSNAKKAGANSMLLLVTETTNRSGLQIALKDNGCGIPTNKVDRLFKERIESDNGSGVGLIGVKMIISCHDADISIENANSDGNGITEFSIKELVYVESGTGGEHH